MRELTALVVGQVGGGSDLTEYAATGGILGSIYGAAVEGAMAGAARFGPQGALLGAIFGMSYGGSSWLIDEYFS